MSIVCVKHRYICQLGVRECPECETFAEKLERAYLEGQSGEPGLDVIKV